MMIRNGLDMGENEGGEKKCGRLIIESSMLRVRLKHDTTSICVWI